MLRGFALLGVFIVHFVAGAVYILPLDNAIKTAWLREPGHGLAMFFTEWLARDKANTLFAVLFGMGFQIMLERLEARRADFAAVYARRLAILLAIGLLNVALVFPGDVLHEYALLGFLLLAMRTLPMNAMLAIALPLLFFGGALGHAVTDALGFDHRWVSDEQAAVFASGGFRDWAMWQWPAHLRRDVIELGGLSWALHLFGRLLIGAWIVRRGWLVDISHRARGMRAGFASTIAAGLTFELVALLAASNRDPGIASFYPTLHGVGAPLLALGYALGLIRLFNSPSRTLAALFAPVGRTALTAYVAHGAIFTVLYFPFGLDLLGVLGPAPGILVALTVFGLFTLLARWWLARFRYGPLEYLWRWGTYGSRPPFRV